MTTYTERRVLHNKVTIAMNDQEVQRLLSLDPDTIEWHQLRRGDVITIETVKVSFDTVMEKEYRFGYNGMLRERQTNRKEAVTTTETRKLWKTAKRDWYWK